MESEIESIKSSIEVFAINANQIINDKNVKLKSEKDNLVSSLFHANSRLKRIEDNLKYGSTVNKKNFDKLKEYFPNVDSTKLAKVDQFHSGVTRILKAELRNEKNLLEDRIRSLEIEIGSIDEQLVQSVGNIDKPSGLVDNMLELSIEEKGLRDQIRFRDIKATIDTEVVDLSGQITQKVVDSLSSIESILNSAMSEYINRFYEDNPVNPEIKLSETRYEFSHSNDSGTGKAYANMIAMDLGFLEKTYLPALIHDLVVFSNIEDHALEEIFNEYASSKKQVFIAIDKLTRFKNKTQQLAKDHKFLALDSKNLAFGKSWKKRT